jgi:hypothetical protein
MIRSTWFSSRRVSRSKPIPVKVTNITHSRAASNQSITFSFLAPAPTLHLSLFSLVEESAGNRFIAEFPVKKEDKIEISNLRLSQVSNEEGELRIFESISEFERFMRDHGYLVVSCINQGTRIDYVFTANT